MSTLIAYASKYGCTENCARKLSEKLSDTADLLNLKTTKNVDLSKYDKVIIGSSVYIGRIHKEVSEFCSNNLETLKNKKLGLFICGMQEKDAIAKELKDAYPEELSSRAVIQECFGGEFIFSKMKFMDKLITKKITKIDKDTSTISEDIINKFVQAMNTL